MQVNENNPIAALNYVGLGNGSLLLEGITTTAGGINFNTGGPISVDNFVQLSATGGGISLVQNGAPGVMTISAGSSLVTSGGSVFLQNNAFAVGTLGLDIQGGVQIHASGTAKGVGQVDIVLGDAPPPNQLALGVIPAANTPLMISSGGALTVTYATTTDNTGTIKSTGTGNVLNAEGRNVVFYNGGSTNGGIIQLDGSVNITADPPIGPAASAAASVSISSSIAPSLTWPVSSVTGIAGGAFSVHSPDMSGSLIAAPTSSSVASGLSNIAAFNEMQVIDGLAPSVPAAQSQSLTQPLPSIQSQLQQQSKESGSQSDLYSIEDWSASARATSTTGSQLDKKESPLTGFASNCAVRQLEQGPLLLAPEENTTVQTRYGAVDVAARAVALIIAFKGGVAVYNLHDYKHDSVVIRSAGHRIALAPGRNAVVTKQSVRYFEEANPADFVGYRKLSAKSFDDGVKVLQSEFNILSLMQGIAPVKAMMLSPTPEHKKACASILKTAAILQTIGDGTPFELMPRTRIATTSMMPSAPVANVNSAF